MPEIPEWLFSQKVLAHHPHFKTVLRLTAMVDTDQCWQNLGKGKPRITKFGGRWYVLWELR